MPPRELAQLELLTDVDDLLLSLREWSQGNSAWDDVQRQRQILQRLLERLEPVRARLESPLVVATFGGTGTGKSSLVNALVGQDLTQSARQRPTTREPVLLAHPETSLSPYDLPLDELRVVHCDAPLLREIVLLDCPDSDTSDDDSEGSNLARLKRVLPYCDVLLYISTQQKYSSARVGQELAQAAAGCRLVFIQTHADVDEDIRDDWRAELEKHFQVTDMFFIDCLASFDQQRRGELTGEFGRLNQLLFRQLAETQRARIRRANLLGLIEATVNQILDVVRQRAVGVNELQQHLDHTLQQMLAKLRQKLQAQLGECTGDWERRVLETLVSRWGLSPLTVLLRVYLRPASWLASLSMLRARSTAQVALLGAWQMSEWLKSLRQGDNAAERSLQSLMWSDSDRDAARTSLGEWARRSGMNAGMRSQLLNHGDSTSLAAEFLEKAAQQTDETLGHAAAQHQRWTIRLWYELLSLSFPFLMILLIAKNFFYEALWLGKDYLDLRFYLPALLFTIIWEGLVLAGFTFRVRRRLGSTMQQVVGSLASVHLHESLFPRLSTAITEFNQTQQELEVLAGRCLLIRQRGGDTPHLGELRTPDGR